MWPPSQHADSLVWAKRQGPRGSKRIERAVGKRVKTRTQGTWEHLPPPTRRGFLLCNCKGSDLRLSKSPSVQFGAGGGEIRDRELIALTKLVYFSSPGHDSTAQPGQGIRLPDSRRLWLTELPY